MVMKKYKLLTLCFSAVLLGLAVSSRAAVPGKKAVRSAHPAAVPLTGLTAEDMGSLRRR